MGVVPACTPFAEGDDRAFAALQPPLGDAGAQGLDPWRCLGEAASALLPPVDPSRSVNYSASVRDFVTRQPVAGLIVRLCAVADVACDNPVVPWFAAVDGKISVRVPLGFFGYFELMSPSTLPATSLLERPVEQDTEAGYFYLVPSSAFLSLSQGTGTAIDQSLGYVGVNAFNCQGEPAAGMRVELQGATGAVPFYVIAGLPSFGAVATDADGLAGFLNVPPGVTVLQGTVANGSPRDEQIVATRSLFVRAGWQTGAALRPDGAPLTPAGP